MTMHLLPAFFTTTGSSKKNKKKVKTKAQIEHEKWLEKRGLSPSQLKDKKKLDPNWKEEYTSALKVERKYSSSGMSGSSDSCVKKDIMTRLHKEPEHVRREILEKASRVMPLFNKGGLQYATPETDMKSVGTKSRRG
jgi:hypothetical protein